MGLDVDLSDVKHRLQRSADRLLQELDIPAH